MGGADGAGRRAHIKRMETHSTKTQSINPGPTFMNSSHMSRRPRPPHTPPDRPQPDSIKISTTCSQLSRCGHERVRPRPPQRGARGPAGSRRIGAQQHQVAPRRRLRVQLVLDVLATGAWHLVWVKGHGYGWGPREFVRALLGTGGGHTSFAMLFSQPVAWSTLDRVRVRVKVIGFWLFGHSRWRAAPWCTWVRGRSGRPA